MKMLHNHEKQFARTDVGILDKRCLHVGSTSGRKCRAAPPQCLSTFSARTSIDFNQHPVFARLAVPAALRARYIYIFNSQRSRPNKAEACGDLEILVTEMHY